MKHLIILTSGEKDKLKLAGRALRCFASILGRSKPDSMAAQYARELGWQAIDLAHLADALTSMANEGDAIEEALSLHRDLPFHFMDRKGGDKDE